MKDGQFYHYHRAPAGRSTCVGSCAAWLLYRRSTLEEAREMAADAIRAYCASLLKHGEPIPCDSPEEQYVGRLSVALEPA